MKIIYFLILVFINQLCLAIGDPKYEILDMEITNNLPFIKFQIEDQEARFLLDTGARNQVLVLNKDMLSKLATVKPFPVKEKSSDITGKEYIAKKYILPQFNIGKISFLQLRIVEDTNWGLSTEIAIPNKDGVVGLELFINKGIIIDYPQSKLTIIDRKIPPEYDVDNWHELKFKVDRYGVSIYTEINTNEEKRFILDSGSTLSLIKTKSVGKNIVSNNCTLSLNNDGKCSYLKAENVIINNLKIGEIFFYIYDFPNEFEPDGILGYDFLFNKVIYIDFNKRVIKIKDLKISNENKK